MEVICITVLDKNWLGENFCGKGHVQLIGESRIQWDIWGCVLIYDSVLKSYYPKINDYNIQIGARFIFEVFHDLMMIHLGM